MRLSARRADAVEQFLIQNGVSPAQLTSKGYGPDKPVATNKTAAGRSQNRRVELTKTD
jgi:OOP family OmpA-OmpF porin